MRIRPELLVLSSLLLLGGGAACVNDPNRESESPNYDAARLAPEQDALLGPLQPIHTIYLNHPWIGRQVRLRDYTGDVYDRCLGPKALPGTGVALQAELCYPRGLDTLQWFTVVGTVYSPGPAVNQDPMRVALRSVYNPSYCVDVAWGTASGGEAIQLYPCHWGSNQWFHLPVPGTSSGTSATGPVLTKNSNYAMAFEAGAPNGSGTVKPVTQRPYSAGQVFQRWTVQVR